MLLKKTILIFFLFALFGKTECYKYLSMALTVRQDGSHTSYNLPFIINAYEYELSISLTSVANYFHNYQQVAADKNTVAK